MFLFNDDRSLFRCLLELNANFALELVEWATVTATAPTDKFKLLNALLKR